jgi:hypothetical protein
VSGDLSKSNILKIDIALPFSGHLPDVYDHTVDTSEGGA